MRGSRVRLRRTVCWRAGCRSAACASCSCSIADGTSIRSCPNNFRGSARIPIRRARRSALIQDLSERGLLKDTLVVWGGEFGRTVYCQGKLTPENYGRDHHPRCFTMWLAGGGIKPGITHGETDDYCYNVVKDPVHVHDLHATMLQLLGIDHTRLTYKFQGRNFRLTDVAGNVVKDLLA
jgi:Protein of unknown function (DUF1501)